LGDGAGFVCIVFTVFTAYAMRRPLSVMSATLLQPVLP